MYKKAICIKNINKHNYKIETLTIGKIYDVCEYSSHIDYLLIEDDGQTSRCPKDWFIDINIFREQKLKRILDDNRRL